MQETADDIKRRNEILDAFIEEVSFTGFTHETLEHVYKDLFKDNKDALDHAKALFPKGLIDIANAYSSRLDEQMLKQLETSKITPIKIRDKVAFAVEKRLDLIKGQRDMVKGCASYWSTSSKSDGASQIWATADKIWIWAGDTSTDYNHYTKRALLSGVILSTVLYWLNDSSADQQDSIAFLHRRIDNVLKIGSIIGKPMKNIANIFTTIKNKKDAKKQASS